MIHPSAPTDVYHADDRRSEFTSREREREREGEKKAEAGSRFNLPLKIPACITRMSIHLKGVSVVLQFVQKPPPRAPAVLDGIRTDVNFDVHTPLQGK